MYAIGLAFILLTVSVQSWAQTAAMTASLGKIPKWSGFAAMGYSSNLYDRDSSNFQQFGRASLMVDYRIQGSNILRATGSGYQEGHGNQETRLNDSTLGWVNNAFYYKGPVLSAGQQIRAVLPTSRESQLRDERRFGITVAPIAIINLAPAGFTGASLIYVPALNKNFHKYRQTRGFENNTEYSLAHTATLSWSFSDHWYLQPSFTYANSWTYQNAQRDPNYQFAMELGRSMGKGFTVAMGVTNAGAVRNFQQGSDQTIELFDNKTASVYSEVFYAF